MKALFVFAAASGMLSVILGAFAAHGLKQKLPENLLSAFQTGVEYQMAHSLAILLIVLLHKSFNDALMVYAAGAMAVGIMLFSGSLYLLAITQVKWFGPVTPLGGLAFIVGWGLLIAAALRSSGVSQ